MKKRDAEQADEDLDFVLRTDVTRLDEQWDLLPRVHHHYSLRLADARRRHSEAEAELEVQEAELSKSIRLTPERYGHNTGKAPSNDVVEMLVLLQPEYREARREVIQAKHEVDVLQATIHTLGYAKANFENQTFLWAKDYNSAPREPDVGPAERERVREKLDQGKWRGVRGTTQRRRE